jgi:uncharacterized membrane protein YfcA
MGDLEKKKKKFEFFDWNLLLGYTGGTVLGIFIGFYLADKIPNKSLKVAFGYMILLVGLYILVKETLLG